MNGSHFLGPPLQQPNLPGHVNQHQMNAPHQPPFYYAQPQQPSFGPQLHAHQHQHNSGPQRNYQYPQQQPSHNWSQNHNHPAPYDNAGPQIRAPHAQGPPERMRRPEPHELHDRLVAGAICARTEGQSYEDAMYSIAGAHGFTAGEWALYLLSRLKNVGGITQIILRPPSAVPSGSTATNPAPTSSVTIAQKRTRSQTSTSGSETDSDCEEQRKRLRRSLPRAAKVKKEPSPT
ncbi:hypothetical protein PENSPDRAFT_756488 [Peniophora sp. CONT]|nr:hypothetical protein PENSPDRAFT_756488 [Peniophora sp. CONT]